MENMYKGLTVPTWVLIVCPKIPQMPQNLSAQFVTLSVRSLIVLVSLKVLKGCVISFRNVPLNKIYMQFRYAALQSNVS